MAITSKLLRPFRRYLRDDSASVTVEAVMIFPILIWGYFGMFMLFDAYRAVSSNIRVSYTISDLLSREEHGVDAAYIEGLNNIQEVLTQTPERTVLRVSSVQYDLDNDEYILGWSYSTTGQDAIEQADMAEAIVPYMPPMQDGSYMIVVETWMVYVPFMNITIDELFESEEENDGIQFGPFFFEALVTTKPRTFPKLIFES